MDGLRAMRNAVARTALPPVQGKPRAEELLFRPEVLEARRAQWLGTVLLEPRISYSLFGVAAIAAVLAVLALLLFGTYTRKARLNGWLVPQQGLARVFAPQPGVVTEIHTREGASVVKGAPLLTLSAEVRSESLVAVRAEVVRQLASRRDSMAAAKGVQERLFEQQAADMESRLRTLDSEQRHLARELELQRRRLEISESGLARERAMRARDLIPLSRLQRTEQDHLDQAARLQGLERNQGAHERERMQLRSALQELPFRRQTQLAEIERAVAALEQELAEAETRRQVVITAPQDGTVTAMQVEPGGNANPNVPLLSIIPAGSALQAHLFSPSRAIGFVRPGHTVLLRYQAFPYQKFGSYEGTVASVSRSALSPSELNQQLTGLTSLYGQNEPVYRVTVDLARQNATAYGAAVPLQPGMQLEADVTIEKRRLMEWILDPLYTITGK